MATSVGREHRLEDLRLLGQQHAVCVEQRMQLQRGKAHVHRGVDLARATADRRDAERQVAVQRAQVARRRHGGRRKREEEWRELTT